MNTIVKIVQSVQEYSSRNTSMNKHKVPVGFKKITWKPNTINLDYGGGKYDTATEYLKDFGVENLIYDPYNRDDDFNINTLEKCQDGVDSATLMNVLNVIKEIEIQEEIINNIYMMLKDGCPLFIKIHEGDKSGEGRITLKDCWQNNKKTKDYLQIVKKVFGNNVMTKHGLIIAMKQEK